MIRLKNWVLPTPANNYKAQLISKTALVIYILLLLVLNFFNGNFPVVKSYALLNETDVVKAHNVERQKIGLPPLVINKTLTASAKAKGEAMLAHNCWSHYCPDGKSPWEFFKSAGYNYTFAGENLAEGFSTSEAMMQAWMNSKTHRENILKSPYTEVGVAFVTGDYQGVKNNMIVVVHFGTPKNARALSASPEAETIPIISQPDPNSIITNQLPEIKGSYNKDLSVNINAQKSGRILTDGGVFTYRPENNLPIGDYTVVAEDFENPEIKSLPLKFTIAPIDNASGNVAPSNNILSTLNPVQIIGLAIVSLLIILFAADFIAINRINLKHNLRLKTRAHLHLPSLIILLILSFMGNLNGLI